MGGGRAPGPLRRLARGHGMTRSPLRRTAHRVEAALTALLVLLGMAVLPVVAGLAGGIYHRELADVTRIASQRVQVDAVLVTEPLTSATGRDDGLSDATAMATWQVPGGARFTERLRVNPALHPGQSVRIWSDLQGHRTTAPKSPGDVFAAALIIGIDLVVLGWLLLGGLWWVACRVLDRVNASWWEAQWARTGPRWSRRSWQ